MIATHPHAITAIIAADMRHIWGRDASLRFILNRGCPLSLYRLACQLHATERI